MGAIGEIRNSEGTMLFKMYESHADARRQAFRTHYHTEIELSLIISGSGTYNTEGRLYPVMAGDVFFYKSSVAHCMTDIAEGGMIILNVHISPIYFHLVRSAADAPHFGREFLARSFDTVRLNDILSESEAAAVRELIGRIRYEMTERCEGYELISEAYLSEILVKLARHFPRRSDHAATESSDIIFRTLEFIDSHYTEPISLATLSEEARLEKTYFATLFKRVMGTNPWEYILIKRIERAVELLRSEDSNVLVIAGKVGFNNTANFNKIFKKYTGMTPKELRRGVKR